MTASLFSDPQPAETLSGEHAPPPALDPFHSGGFDGDLATAQVEDAVDPGRGDE